VPEVSTPGKQVALNSRTAETVVETYRQQIADAEFQPSRGFVFRSNRKDQPVAVQRQEMLADALLPPEVRRQIKSNNTDKLIVIPDGPLHKLPLEALVIDSGKEPRYLLDELPPIVYAPSLSILSLLTDRKPGAGGPLTLLSVCNPTYPQLKESEKGIVAVDYAVGIRGQLPTLPFTAQESRSIRAGFPDKQVKVLEGDDATEPAVAEAVRGKRILHIAAHGFADTRFGNLFGALALTPPAPGKEKANNDGFLSLHEIYALPLQDCELAVLSACVTNVGPQRAMEAGVTLASGFLVAGARRVVASQWSVDDNSTAVLMGRFFKEVTAAADRGQPISYAEALQQARKHIRGQAKWSSPYYWAPFVLLGPEN
jgi:CHAT domain-containing protein